MVPWPKAKCLFLDGFGSFLGVHVSMGITKWEVFGIFRALFQKNRLLADVQHCSRVQGLFLKVFLILRGWWNKMGCGFNFSQIWSYAACWWVPYEVYYPASRAFYLLSNAHVLGADWSYFLGRELLLVMGCFYLF